MWCTYVEGTAQEHPGANYRSFSCAITIGAAFDVLTHRVSNLFLSNMIFCQNKIPKAVFLPHLRFRGKPLLQVSVGWIRLPTEDTSRQAKPLKQLLLESHFSKNQAKTADVSAGKLRWSNPTVLQINTSKAKPLVVGTWKRLCIPFHIWCKPPWGYAQLCLVSAGLCARVVWNLLFSEDKRLCTVVSKEHHRDFSNSIHLKPVH